MGKGRKWSSLDDEALARAFVSVSEDAIRGTDQKGIAFWESVKSKTDILTNHESVDRTIQAFKNRWTILSHDVNKFVGCMTRVEARNASGKNDQDILNDALLLYRESNKSDFLFLSAWQILKDCPKFSTFSDRSTYSVNNRKRHLSDNDDVESDRDEQTARPIGCKKAKLGVKTKTTEKLLNALLENSKCRNDRLIEEMQRKNDILQDEVNIKLFMTDPDSAETKEYLNLLKKKRLFQLRKEIRQLNKNEDDYQDEQTNIDAYLA